MNLHEGKALEIAQQFIKDKNYRNYVLGKPYFVPHGSKESEESIDYWVVPFEHTIFDIEDAFVYIEDSTGNIMYILTGHGYSYINGVPKPEPEDDGEDWDDL